MFFLVRIGGNLSIAFAVGAERLASLPIKVKEFAPKSNLSKQIFPKIRNDWSSQQPHLTFRNMYCPQLSRPF